MVNSLIVGRLVRVSQLSAVALMLASASAQAVLTIALDDFRDPLLPSGNPLGDLVVNSGNLSASSGLQVLSVPSLAGSNRTISLDYVSGPSSGAASTLDSPGRLSFSGGPGGLGGTAGTVATLVASYDLTGPIDFTAGGGDAFSVDRACMTRLLAEPS